MADNHVLSSKMNVSQLFYALCKDESENCNLPLFVESLQWDRSLASCDSKQLQNVLQYVKSSLHVSNRRLDGLYILNVLVEQCTSSVFESCHADWMQGIVKALTDPQKNVRLLASEVFERLLAVTSGFSDFSSKLTPKLLTNFLKTFLNEVNKKSQDEGDLKVLFAVLRYYPGQCRTFVSSIMRRVVKALHSEDDDVVDVATSCIALMPYVREDSSPKSFREQNWTKLFRQLLGSLHDSLNGIYDGVEPVHLRVDVKEKLISKDLFDDPNKIASFTYYRQIIAFIICLQKMLTTGGVGLPHPFLVVPIEDIMQLVCRVMNINGTTKFDFNSRKIFMAYLPKLHYETIQLTVSLLKSCRGNMALHSGTVLQIVLRTLQWTSRSNDAASDRLSQPLEPLRISAYHLLEMWIEIVCASGCLTLFDNNLITHILSDISPIEQPLLLLNKNISVKQKSGSFKAKKAKLAFDHINANRDVTRVCRPFENSELCVVALETLRKVVYLGGEVLKVKHIKDIHQTALKLLFRLQTSLDMPVPYGDPKCRCGLYRLLLATVVVQHPQFAPELSTCISVFFRGVVDVGHDVSFTCTEALGICQLVTNPRRRSVQLALATSSVGKVSKPVEIEEEEEEEIELSQLTLLSAGPPVTSMEDTSASVANDKNVDAAIATEDNVNISSLRNGISHEVVENGSLEENEIEHTPLINSYDEDLPMEQSDVVADDSPLLLKNDSLEKDLKNGKFDEVNMVTAVVKVGNGRDQLEDVLPGKKRMNTMAKEHKKNKKMSSGKRKRTSTTIVPDFDMGRNSDSAVEMLSSFIDCQPDD